MSEFVSPSAEPNYIARLALQSAPFNAAVEPNIFFKGVQIEQRFNLLLHLIRASDKVGLLSAGQGFGKSTLLTQLQHNKTDDLRICRINGHVSLTSMEIIMQCLPAFGVDDNDVKFSNDHLILLKDRLSGLHQLNIKPLLLIDDIDLLSEEPLMVLMDCLSWQKNNTFLLQAVFTSKQALPALSNIHGRLQQIDLPELSEQEVLLYLKYRLEAVGYRGESVFSLKDLKSCFRQSAGIPALINQWAHQHLLGMKSSSTNPIKVNIERVAPLLRWSGLGFLVISLILLLLFQDSINDMFSAKTVNEIVIEKPFISQDDALATVILDEDKITSSAQAEREELKSLVSELAAIVAKPEKEPTVISPDEVISLEPDLAQTIVTKPILNSEPVLQPEPILQQKLSVAIHQKEWILQQHATDYTFQLMGSWDKQEVGAFLEKYALAGDVAEFDSMRNGRVWYALIYGVYDNKQAALDASSTWPAPINTLPSWLRRFDSVQQQIKKTAN
ncbi:MAG: DamX protein [Methylophagaceae bacterium]|jgi:DamX protein